MARIFGILIFFFSLLHFSHPLLAAGGGAAEGAAEIRYFVDAELSREGLLRAGHRAESGESLLIGSHLLWPIRNGVEILAGCSVGYATVAAAKKVGDLESTSGVSGFRYGFEFGAQKDLPWRLVLQGVVSYEAAFSAHSYEGIRGSILKYDVDEQSNFSIDSMKGMRLGARAFYLFEQGFLVGVHYSHRFLGRLEFDSMPAERFSGYGFGLVGSYAL